MVACHLRNKLGNLVGKEVSNRCKTNVITGDELAHGRKHGATTSREHAGAPTTGAKRVYWHRIPEKERSLQSACALLPDNAVLCEECSNYSRSKARGFKSDDETKALDVAEAQAFINENVELFTGALLPEALFALQSMLRVRLYLNDPTSTVAATPQRKSVWTRNGSASGGVVTWTGSRGNRHMPRVIRGLLAQCVHMCNDGVQAVVEQLDGMHSTQFWAAIGGSFNDHLVDNVNKRLKLMRSKPKPRLHALTNWREDWRVNIHANVKAFFWYALSSRSERELHRHVSDSRLSSKFNQRFAIVNDCFHAVDPACNQPLHVATGRMLHFHGRNKGFREFLSRTGRTDSYEAGRMSQIFDAQEGQALRQVWMNGKVCEVQRVQEIVEEHGSLANEATAPSIWYQAPGTVASHELGGASVSPPSEQSVDSTARIHHAAAMQSLLELSKLCIAIGLVDDNIDFPGAISRLHSMLHSGLSRGIHFINRSVRQQCLTRL